jgi:MFS family permease
MPETLILLRIQQLGVSVASVLLLWAALHVVRSSSSFIGGALADRFGAARVMWLGWVSYAAIAYGLAQAGGPKAALSLFLVLGVVAGLTESPERAIVSKLAGGKQGTDSRVSRRDRSALAGTAARRAVSGVERDARVQREAAGGSRWRCCGLQVLQGADRFKLDEVLRSG